jgi:hypothetical protein
MARTMGYCEASRAAGEQKDVKKEGTNSMIYCK